MKFKKRTIIIISIIVILVSVGFILNKNKNAKLEAEKQAKMVYSVKRGDIKTEVKVPAIANLANEQNLSFGREGKITNVFVKVGDEVKAGSVLAELNMDEYQNSISAYRLELENSQLGLQKLLNNDTSLRESQINSQINEAESNYNVEIEQEKILKQQLATIMQQKKDEFEQLSRDYKLSEKNLEIAKSELAVSTTLELEQNENSSISRQQTLNSIINSLNTSLGDIEYIVESVDKIFGVSIEFKDDNDEYENYLSVRDINLKNETELNIISSYDLINKFTNEFKNITLEMSDDQIYQLIQDFYKESSILIELCDTALDSIDMSIESVNSLSSTTIEGFKVTINTSRTSAVAVRNSLETLSTTVNSLLSSTSREDQLAISIKQKELVYEGQEILLKSKKENLLSLAQNLINLKDDHDNQLKRKEASIKNISERVLILKQELNDILDGPDAYDIQQQKNLISQSELRLERVLDQKDDYQIIAEFDGRVRTVELIEGEQYKLDDRKFIVVENPNLIELELQVNQIDIVKIKKGDPALITFDAFSNNPINANISNRSVNPEANGRGGIFYKVDILLEKQELEILAGMSALVTITTDKANNVLLIPSLALIHENDKQYIYIKDKEEYKRHEIKTGIVNNFQAEVIEGLIEGNIIRSSVLDDEALKEMGIDEGSANIFGG